MNEKKINDENLRFFDDLHKKSQQRKFNDIKDILSDPGFNISLILEKNDLGSNALHLAAEITDEACNSVSELADISSLNTTIFSMLESKLIEEKISSQEFINKRTPQGNSVLDIAILKSNECLVNHLLNKYSGILVFSASQLDLNIFHYSATNCNNTSIIKSLLSVEGINRDINERNLNGYSPIQIAISNNCTGIVYSFLHNPKLRKQVPTTEVTP